ncbi:MAG TPA: FAD-dependent oxidoreductase, partial [Puia sp.]|nr:FAD-dependent oxidoreductase [Puia sp.]
MTKTKAEQNPQNGISTSGTHETCWFDSSLPTQKFEPLKESITTDVVIVGGGLAGLSTAYCLASKGLKVVVVEDGEIGSGETGRTTAQLVTAYDDRYYHLASLFGEKNTKLIAESHKKAIDFVEKTIAKEHIHCDFERLNGYLFLHTNDDKDSLKKELEAATKAGIHVEELDKIPGLLKDDGKCIMFPEQAQFHPIKYLYGLCKAIEKKGGLIYTKTHANKIDNTGIVTSKGHSVKARHIVIATNSPVNNKYAIHLKQNGYRTYVIASLIEKGTVKKALWWDTGDKEANPSVPPYHYVRIMDYNDKYDLLISG